LVEDRTEPLETPPAGFLSLSRQFTVPGENQIRAVIGFLFAELQIDAADDSTCRITIQSLPAGLVVPNATASFRSALPTLLHPHLPAPTRTLVLAAARNEIRDRYRADGLPVVVAPRLERSEQIQEPNP